MTDKYFSGLNYTLGNEDTTLEIEICKDVNPVNIFSICGSGGRSLPLVTDDTKLLTMADLSKEQLMLSKLREHTYKELSYDEFLKFWGYFPYRDNDNCDFRKKIFYGLKLDAETKSFFEKVFVELDFCSILYIGKWERTFNVLAKINRTLLGKDFDQILRFDNLSDQIAYYQSHFPLLKWKLVLFLLGNKSMFNALLYKGDFIEKNSHLSHFDYYFNAFHRLFSTDIAKKSFFLHLCFYGRINSHEGLPVEAQINSFNQIKKFQGSINLINQDFVTYLNKTDEKYDFLSLSDVPSYFKGDLERDYMQLIKGALRPGAIIVVRYYLRRAHADLKNFEDITSTYRSLIDRELVQMYDISVYRYNP